MMSQQNYTIIDATIEVLTKFVKLIANLLQKIFKWAYNDF